MKQNRTSTFTSLWFLFGLIVLLLNDLLLKELYGNWLTGKLSDFAGLFVFTLFWTALLPKHKDKIFVFTTILFVYWKSPYSESLITMWNSLNFWNINRIVDYSDVIALAILPLAYYIDALKEKIVTIRFTPYLPLIICVYAFVATSRARSNTDFNDNSAVYHIKHYSRESFMSELNNIGLDVTSSKYHNTKYDDEHTEIINLNDSIGNLVIMVGDFDTSSQTVAVSLGSWEYKNTPRRLLPDKELQNQRAYVKSVFKQKVVDKLSK